MQGRSPTFCVDPSAETIFVLACMEKSSPLGWVFRLFANFILQRLFSIGSYSYRKLTKSNVGVPLSVCVLVQKKFLV